MQDGSAPQTMQLVPLQRVQDEQVKGNMGISSSKTPSPSGFSRVSRGSTKGGAKLGSQLAHQTEPLLESETNDNESLLYFHWNLGLLEKQVFHPQ